MFDREDVVERIIAHLRTPVGIDPALDARVMTEIRTAPATAIALPGRRAWRWLALAAGVAGLLLFAPWRSRSAASSDALQFVFVSPGAASVALVGDFNDWDPGRTPMRAARQGVWATVVPLAPGRYRYAFLVNGVEWRADPSAPRALDDGFGAPSSVVTVSGQGAGS